MNNTKNYHFQQMIFVGVVFFSMLIFFTEVHPFILFDGDDWKDMAELRNIAFPKWHDWNPSKVLPETLMALTGYLGAYIFVPLIGDYLKGISLAVAIVVASFITVYVILLKDTLVKEINIKNSVAAGIAFLFLLLHFLIFKNGAEGNYYLFSTLNVDCLFHYVIPFLLNASMVLYFISRTIKGNYAFSSNRQKSSIFIFVIFLAIYSNILLSIVFISYIVGMILKELLSQTEYSLSVIKACFKENKLYTGIIVVWIISLLFEANGGRAHNAEMSSMAVSVVQTVANFIWIFAQGQKGLNIMLCYFCSCRYSSTLVSQ